MDVGGASPSAEVDRGSQGRAANHSFSEAAAAERRAARLRCIIAAACAPVAQKEAQRRAEADASPAAPAG